MTLLPCLLALLVQTPRYEVEPLPMLPQFDNNSLIARGFLADGTLIVWSTGTRESEYYRYKSGLYYEIATKAEFGSVGIRFTGRFFRLMGEAKTKDGKVGMARLDASGWKLMTPPQAQRCDVYLENATGEAAWSQSLKPGQPYQVAHRSTNGTKLLNADLGMSSAGPIYLGDDGRILARGNSAGGPYKMVWWSPGKATREVPMPPAKGLQQLLPADLHDEVAFSTYPTDPSSPAVLWTGKELVEMLGPDGSRFYPSSEGVRGVFHGRLVKEGRRDRACLWTPKGVIGLQEHVPNDTPPLDAAWYVGPKGEIVCSGPIGNRYGLFILQEDKQ